MGNQIVVLATQELKWKYKKGLGRPNYSEITTSHFEIILSTDDIVKSTTYHGKLKEGPNEFLDYVQKECYIRYKEKDHDFLASLATGNQHLVTNITIQNSSAKVFNVI